MKDAVVRFRCSEKEKAIIEALSRQDPYSGSVSEYLLSLVMREYKDMRFVNIDACLWHSGKQSQPKHVGEYLIDESGRTSMSEYISMIDKARELFPSWNQSGKSIKLYFGGKEIPTPSPMADYVCIDGDSWK